MAEDQFPVVLRGYDKERVDQTLAASRSNLARLRQQIKADDDRILKLEAELQEAKSRKVEQPRNSFASLGANAQQLLGVGPKGGEGVARLFDLA